MSFFLLGSVTGSIRAPRLDFGDVGERGGGCCLGVFGVHVCQGYVCGLAVGECGFDSAFVVGPGFSGGVFVVVCEAEAEELGDDAVFGWSEVEDGVGLCGGVCHCVLLVIW